MRSAIRLVVLAVMLAASGSAARGQTPATAHVMRDKLAHSSAILGALMTSNYSELARESRALSDATRAPGWVVLKTPEYSRYSSAFQRAADDLVNAAEQRDFDGAMIDYTSLTLTCYQCHRYVKGARIAGRRP